MHSLHRAAEQLRHFPVVRGLCLSAVSFLLSACQVGGMYAPWGLAAVAGSGGGRRGFFAALGTVLGALAFFAFQPGLRYGAAAILIYCGSLTFAGTALSKKVWFRPLLSAAMLLAVQSVYLIGRGSSALLTCLTAGACTGMCTLLWGCLTLPGAAGTAESAAVPESGAAAFHALYDSFFSGTETPGPENPSVLFDRAAEQVCRDCTLRGTCWQTDYAGTYDAFNTACPKLLARRQALAEDFPGYFASRCIRFPRLLQAIDRELYTYLLRQQYHRRLRETQTIARQQYAQMGDILASARQTVSAAGPCLRYRTGSALRPKEGESVCGDQLAVFRTEGALYLLISDGMGSGSEAHAEAAMVVRLLRQFLCAGIDPLPALRTLNSALRLRGQSGGGYTTIDLLELPLDGGKAALYKYGAARSYCKAGGRVLVLGGQSFPAGLEAADELPDITRLTPQEGAMLVLVSDGVVAGGDGWLRELLRDRADTDPDALCSAILAASAAHGALADDCAAAAVYVESVPEKSAVAV